MNFHTRADIGNNFISSYSPFFFLFATFKSLHFHLTSLSSLNKVDAAALFISTIFTPRKSSVGLHCCFAHTQPQPCHQPLSFYTSCHHGNMAAAPGKAASFRADDIVEATMKGSYIPSRRKPFFSPPFFWIGHFTSRHARYCKIFWSETAEGLFFYLSLCQWWT